MDIDERVLMHIIDARFSENISKWYQSWLLPLHNENKDRMEKMQGLLTTLVNAMEQAKGGAVVVKSGVTAGQWVISIVVGILLFIAGHFWK